MTGQLTPQGIPSLVQCPDWCQLEHGHPYGPDVDLEGLHRFHERSWQMPGLIVAVAQPENAASPAGPVVYPEPVAVNLLSDDRVSMTPELLHAAARMLTDAAQLLAGVPLELEGEGH